MQNGYKFEKRTLSANHKLGGIFEWTRMYSRLLDYLSYSLPESEWNVSPRHAWSSWSLSSDNRDLFVLVSSATYKRYIRIHISYFPRIRINHSRMIAIEKYTLLLPFPGKHHNILMVNVARLNSLAEYLYCIELIFYCDVGHWFV